MGDLPGQVLMYIEQKQYVYIFPYSALRLDTYWHKARGLPTMDQSYFAALLEC